MWAPSLIKLKYAFIKQTCHKQITSAKSWHFLKQWSISAACLPDVINDSYRSQQKLSSIVTCVTKQQVRYLNYWAAIYIQNIIILPQ